MVASFGLNPNSPIKKNKQNWMKFVPSKIIKSSSRSKGKDLTDEIEKWRRKIKERSGSQISASPLNLRIEWKSPELKVKTKTWSRRISNIGAELNRKHINKIVDRHEDLNERNVSNEGNYRGLFIIQPNQSCANKITRVMVSQEYPLYQITPEENVSHNMFLIKSFIRHNCMVKSYLHFFQKKININKLLWLVMNTNKNIKILIFSKSYFY